VSASNTVSLYYEDLAVGRIFKTDSIVVTQEEMLAFASRYDPQPFHLNAEAGKSSVFGGMAASGWLTAALTMRLMILSEFKFGRGVVGLGVESLRWPRPVFAGDRITATIEISAMRLSESKPGYGVVRFTTMTTNQRGELVQSKISNVLVPRRSGSSGSTTT
jgi:acyl dehydratase